MGPLSARRRMDCANEEVSKDPIEGGTLISKNGSLPAKFSRSHCPTCGQSQLAFAWLASVIVVSSADGPQYWIGPGCRKSSESIHPAR